MMDPNIADLHDLVRNGGTVVAVVDRDVDFSDLPDGRGVRVHPVRGYDEAQVDAAVHEAVDLAADRGPGQVAVLARGTVLSPALQRLAVLSGAYGVRVVRDNCR